MLLNLFTKTLFNILYSKIVITLFFILPLTYQNIFSQQDSTKPTQYRRGAELQPGYQSYEQKYFDKNLNEEKRSHFPLESTGVWTELNPKVPRVDYLGVHFVNKDTGWACGDLGALIKTTDGGNSWTVSQTNTTTPILKIRSYNGQIVIASGYYGLILRSTDAGETFEQVTSGVTGDLWGLEMINDTLGWACGNANSLIKTTDSGLNWQVVNIPGYSSDLWWIDFLTYKYGYIAGNGGKVFNTTDGGNSWSEQQTIIATALFTIDIIDSLHLAAAGAGGKHVYSSDGGLTWQETTMFQLPNSPVNCVKYINVDTGYIVVGESVGLYKTTNRGETWQMIANIGEFEINLFPDELTGYAAGTGLKINKAEGNLDIWHKLIINENFTDVFFPTEQRGFIISPPSAGKLYRTENGGINWEENGPSGSGLFFTDSLTGFIANPAYIWKTTNGGDSWYITNGSNGASKIFFINPTIGWALRNNIIYKTTDGGENWFTQFTAPLSVYFNSIYFVDSLYGWTANFDRPYKTTDGSNNWIQQTNLDIWESRDVFFKDNLNGLILESNKIFVTNDGGNTFNLIPGLTGFSIAGRFSHYGDKTIFITGYKTYRTINGGLNWLDFNELTGIRINGLSLLGVGLGCAVGELGFVLKYFDETVPVELISLTAQIEKNIVSLKWSTATETNNQGFFVERKKENESIWSTLTFIDGSGTSTFIIHYDYKDELFQPGKYRYRLKQIDYNGQYEYSDELEIEYINKFDFFLFQNFPNPFNSSTIIKYSIPNTGNESVRSLLVTLKVYDILGNEIIVLVSEEKPIGNYEVMFEPVDLASGVYFYKLVLGGNIEIRKLIFMK